MLDGKPLIAHTIIHALNTPSITRVVVSSDDHDIRVISEQYNAETIVRPKEISGDTASSESALLHSLDYFQEKEGYKPDIVVFLQATSPIRRPDDTENAIQTFLKSKADSLFSAVPAHGFVWRNHQNDLESVTYDYHHRPRRQEDTEHVVENGSIYIFKPWVLYTLNNRLGGKIAVYKMGMLESIQLDEPEDLNFAKWCFAAIQKLGLPK
jgi:CMP-N,N'-diacetyllegionaminic acid synthase